MADDPRLVFVAENAALADAVVKLLAGAGIEAEAVTQPPSSQSEPLTGMSEIIPADEIEILVTDETKAAEAQELLASAVNAAKLRAIRDKRAMRTGTVSAVCEDCGVSSEWPATAMGTTENCPSCGGFMDIPDPDEDWSGVDFGEDEDDDGEEATK